MAGIIFLDGEFHTRETAKVSVFDHGLLYGDGVFEGIRLYDGCVFRLRQHLERLFSGAKYIAMKIPMTIEELMWVTVETCRRNNLRNAYIRLVVTRGEGDLGLAPWLCKIPTIIVIADSIRLYPEEAYTKGLEIVTVPTQRMSPAAMNPRVKSCNYLNNILAKIEAHHAGVSEALMLDSRGYAVECTGDNIFIAKNKVLSTPPTYLGALQGVTRDAIIEMARANGYEVNEEPFTRYEIFDADECFMTGTAAEVVPVVMLDDRPIGDGQPGRITQEMNHRLRDLVTKDGVMIDADLPKPARLTEIWTEARAK